VRHWNEPTPTNPDRVSDPRDAVVPLMGARPRSPCTARPDTKSTLLLKPKRSTTKSQCLSYGLRCARAECAHPSPLDPRRGHHVRPGRLRELGPPARVLEAAHPGSRARNPRASGRLVRGLHRAPARRVGELAPSANRSLPVATSCSSPPRFSSERTGFYSFGRSPTERFSRQASASS
jgi:hypothetical protein